MIFFFSFFLESLIQHSQAFIEAGGLAHKYFFARKVVNGFNGGSAWSGDDNLASVFVGRICKINEL